jgi:hypothetical protein
MEMVHRILWVAIGLFLASCSSETGESTGLGGNDPAETHKADRGELTDVEWANQFFLTQIYDKRWNPDGMENDVESNNCGPASFAMVMAERGILPAGLKGEMAIDHARATMYPSYPDIDATELPDDAAVYEDEGLVFVDDDTHPVYFDKVEGAASVAQGIEQSGGEAVFGNSWAELDALLAAHGAVIAHGHITSSWRDRFPGDYGSFGDGSIPHFIAVLRATAEGKVVVCAPCTKEALYS